MTASEEADAPEPVGRSRGLFESLVRRFYAKVYNYLRWLSRDSSLAEDLTQETFTQIWRHPPEWLGDRALKAWVFRVARNEYLQHRRRPGVETVALDDDGQVVERNSQTPDSLLRLEREQLCHVVRALVDKLPDGYREVIVLHNLEGLPLAQVAEVLEVPAGTVKSRRAKAFCLLRRLVEEEVVRDEM